MQDYGETVNWMYADPAALKHSSGFLDMSDVLAKRSRDDFFPKDALVPDKITGLPIGVSEGQASRMTLDYFTAGEW